MTTTVSEPPASTVSKPRGGRFRGVIAWVLVVVAGILVPLAMVAFWGQRSITDTERWVTTVAPLAQDQAIRDQVANAATEAILKQIGSQNYVVGLRVPEARTLLDAVGKAVEAAFQGTPAGKSLDEADAAWKKAVESYGPQRMKWHYGRSLVRPLTDPVAPPHGK